MNYSLIAADRITHVKIVLVALIASFTVIAAGVYARPTETKLTIGRTNADSPLIKAGKLEAVSDRYSQDRGSI